MLFYTPFAGVRWCFGEVCWFLFGSFSCFQSARTHKQVLCLSVKAHKLTQLTSGWLAGHQCWAFLHKLLVMVYKMFRCLEHVSIVLHFHPENWGRCPIWWNTVPLGGGDQIGHDVGRLTNWSWSDERVCISFKKSRRGVGFSSNQIIKMFSCSPQFFGNFIWIYFFGEDVFRKLIL